MTWYKLMTMILQPKKFAFWSQFQIKLFQMVKQEMVWKHSHKHQEQHSMFKMHMEQKAQITLTPIFLQRDVIHGCMNSLEMPLDHLLLISKGPQKTSVKEEWMKVYTHFHLKIPMFFHYQEEEDKLHMLVKDQTQKLIH